MASKCDAERTQHAAKVLARSPLAEIFIGFVLIIGFLALFLGLPMYVGKVVTDYGYEPFLTDRDISKDPHNYGAAMLWMLQFYFFAAVVAGYIGLWIEGGLVFATAIYLAIAIGICAIIKSLFLWYELNVFLLQNDWLPWLGNIKTAGTLKSGAVLWCMFEFFIVGGAVILFCLIVSTIMHYRHHMQLFDAKRALKKSN